MVIALRNQKDNMPTLDEILEGVLEEGITNPETTTELPVETSPEEDVIVESSTTTEETEPAVEPETPEKKHEPAIPYERFSEVVNERNQLRELLYGKQTVAESEPVEEEEIVFESATEKLLYDKVVALEAKLAEKDTDIEQLKTFTQTQQEQADYEATIQEFDRAIDALGVTLTVGDVQAIALEAASYANLTNLEEGNEVMDATMRAYHYLAGAGKIKPTKADTPSPEPKPNPLESVTSAKQRLTNSPRSTSSPEHPVNIEKILTIEDAIAVGLREAEKLSK